MEGKIAILAPARNCAQHITRSLDLAQSIGEMFNDYRIFVFENFSQDNTAEQILQKASHNTHIVPIVNHVSSQASSPLRTVRIAYARNYLKSSLVKTEFNPDYVLVMDMDDVSAALTPDKIRKMLSLKEKWDGVFPRLTYDIWALRYGMFVTNYWDFKPGSLRMTVGRVRSPAFSDGYGAPRTDNSLFDNDGLMPVFSAFNGYGLYKYDTYVRGVYNGRNIFFASRPSVISEECEHVNFHKSLGPTRLMMMRDI